MKFRLARLWNGFASAAVIWMLATNVVAAVQAGRGGEVDDAVQALYQEDAAAFGVASLEVAGNVLAASTEADALQAMVSESVDHEAVDIADKAVPAGSSSLSEAVSYLVT